MSKKYQKKTINNKPIYQKISQNKNSTKMNVAYAKYLLAKYERESKNYEQEFNYLIEKYIIL